jgi:hypothetical protein
MFLTADGTGIRNGEVRGRQVWQDRGRRVDELDGRSKACDGGRDTGTAGETGSSRTKQRQVVR